MVPPPWAVGSASISHAQDGGETKPCNDAELMRTGARAVTWTTSDAMAAAPPLSLQYTALQESSATTSARPASEATVAEASTRCS